MKSASRAVVGLVAALSLTTAIAEEAVLSNAEVRYVIARADDAGVSAPLPIAESALDAYAGRYDALVGAAFVYREDDGLTIELPQQLGGAPVRLHAAETRDAFTAEGSVRVEFESDASGRVLGLLLRTSSNEVLVASKAPVHRGIVTVHDIAEPRRGIVTIHDLAADDVSSGSVESLVRSF